MKKSEQVLFEINMSDGNSIHAGTIYSNSKDTIRVTTGNIIHPVNTNEWLAEQLLLSFISTTFIRSLLLLADLKHIQIAGFDCKAIAAATLVNNIPKVHSINIYPNIYIEDPCLKEEVKKLIEIYIKNSSTEKVSNIVISYHPIIEIKSMAELLD